MNLAVFQMRTSMRQKKVPVINSGLILNGQVQEGSNRNKTNPAQIKNKQDKHELRFKVWNIHGLKQFKLIKIINKSDKFLNDIFKKSDFVIFTETWSENGDGELFTWDDDNFEEIIRKNGQRTSRRGRSSGGILSSQEKIWRKVMIYFQQTLTESGVGSTKFSSGGNRILLFVFCIYCLQIVIGTTMANPLIMID